MNIIAIILTLGVIVFVHEFGHFIFAKMNHIKVNEFSIGMGPAIATWKKGDTQYSVRGLPIGGYCLMEGMGEASDDENAFNNKSVLARLSVCFAGPLFNFLLAFVLAIILCHNTSIDDTVLTSVMKGSAAEEAGIQAGDEITALDGQRIYNYREITLFGMMNPPEKPVEVTYIRDGQEHKTTLTKKKDEKTGKYYFGFESIGRKSKGFLDEMKYSALEVNFDSEKPATSVLLNYGPSNVEHYVYNNETKMYMRNFNDTPALDYNTKEQVSVRNIIVVKITYYSKEGTKYLELNDTGSGEGYFVTNGKMENITWKKDSRNSQTKYLDSNGEEITVNDGRTLIALIGAEREINIS